jgi:hypothetical protein
MLLLSVGAVCTENLNSHVMVMESAEHGMSDKAPPLHGAVEARARVRKSQSTVINAFYEHLIA